jgi:hypothetical protein
VLVEHLEHVAVADEQHVEMPRLVEPFALQLGLEPVLAVAVATRCDPCDQDSSASFLNLDELSQKSRKKGKQNKISNQVDFISRGFSKFDVRKKGKFDFGVGCSFSMIGLKDRKHEFVLRSPISPSLGDVAERDGLPCEFATVQDFDGCHFSKIRKLVKLWVFDV